MSLFFASGPSYKPVSTLWPNTFLAQQTVRAAANQDGIALLGRAGGTSSYVATLTPAPLGASRTWTVPDRSDTFAGLGAQTFTGAQTVDLGIGSLPTLSASTDSPVLFYSADSTSNTIRGFSFGSGNVGLQFFGRNIGGTRAAPTATPDLAILAAIIGSGSDGIATIGSIGSKARYQQLADGLWSATNTGTMHLFSGTPNGSTTTSEWWRMQNAILSNGGAPTAGNGSIQLANHTTKAGGIAFGTDTFLYRNAALETTIYGSGQIRTVWEESGGVKTQVGSFGGGVNIGFIGTRTAHQLHLTTSDIARIKIGASGELHFSGGTPITKPTVSGSRGGNAALASALIAMANLGLITDSTTA